MGCVQAKILFIVWTQSNTANDKELRIGQHKYDQAHKILCAMGGRRLFIKAVTFYFA